MFLNGGNVLVFLTSFKSWALEYRGALKDHEIEHTQS